MNKLFVKFGLILLLPMVCGQAVFAKTPSSPCTEIKVSPLISQAKTIQNALANQRYNDIIPYIHPVKGVRFSMYSQTYSEKDKVFSRQDFRNYLAKPKIKFTWGEQDGTGDPLIMPLPQYLTTWVKAKEFNTATINTGQFNLTADHFNNWGKIYPNLPYVQFYKKGTAKYGEMDWRHLTFVFDDYKGKPYLVAILNAQWTI